MSVTISEILLRAGNVTNFFIVFMVLYVKQNAYKQRGTCSFIYKTSNLHCVSNTSAFDNAKIN